MLYNHTRSSAIMDAKQKIYDNRIRRYHKLVIDFNNSLSDTQKIMYSKIKKIQDKWHDVLL